MRDHGSMHHARAANVAMAVVVALAAVALGACEPPKPRVVIFGDSITIEAKGSGNAASILAESAVDWSGTKFMTSPCNGLTSARRLTYVPDVVVINYSGNRGSFQDNCMAGEQGPALAERYRRDVQALIDRFRNGTTKIVIVGAPTRRPTMTDDNLVFTALQALAAEPSNQVGFYDGGRFLTPDRQVVSRVAPCLSPRETGTRCGTSKDPTKNYIRDEARNHLCPSGGRLDGTCPTYSSGAVRLSLNLRDGIKVAKVPATKVADPGVR
jgi:hypothetical protein